MNLIAVQAISIEAATRTAYKILSDYSRLASAQIVHKAAGDVATNIDREAEQQLRSRLLNILPESQFLGEETGGVLTNKPTWIVDPIDGTANYVRGYPQWAVSVALAIDQEPVMGIIVDPNRHEIFSAVRGHGAFARKTSKASALPSDGTIPDQPLQCSNRSDPLQCTVGTVFPKPHAEFMDVYLAEFTQVIKHVGQVRRSGSMALELAYLAAGRIDAFWERGMGSWDAAAGIVLLRESGAQIWAMDGLALLQSQYLAASSPSLRPAFEAMLYANH